MSRSCRHLRNMLLAFALWASIILLGWHDSSLVLPLLCILLAMLAGRLLDSLFEMIFYGCWPARLRDQLAGELVAQSG